MRINNHEQTDLQEYLGSYVADEAGRLVFREGALVTAVRAGHWVILDELNLAPSEVLEALNRCRPFSFYRPMCVGGDHACDAAALEQGVSGVLGDICCAVDCLALVYTLLGALLAYMHLLVPLRLISLPAGAPKICNVTLLTLQSLKQEFWS